MNGVFVSVALALSACFGALGCGGSSESHGDDSGSGGSGATGGTGASGGGAAKGGSGGTGGSPATPAAAGLSLNLSPPLAAEVDAGGRTCPAGQTGPFTYRVGKPAPGGTLADGDSGTEVTCTVVGDHAEGEVFGYDTTTKTRLSFSISGTPSTTGNDGVGYVMFFSPDIGTLAVLSGDAACKLGPASVLKDGAVLTDFDCPLLGEVNDMTRGCKATGTVAFEYCKTP